MSQDFNACVRLFEHGQTERAQACTKAFLKSHPRHPQATHFLGLMQHMLGHNARAEKTLAKAVKLDPLDPHTYYNYGLVLNELGREPQAMHAFNKALELAPDFHDAAYSLGALDVKHGHFERGVARLHPLLSIMPDNPGLHSWLGMGLCSLGRYSEAYARLIRALELDPDNVEALISFSKLPLSMFPQAEQYAEKALKLAPESPTVLELYAEWMERRQKLDQARDYAERALERAPGSVGSTLVLSRVERANGQLEASKRRLTKLLKTGKASVTDVDLGHAYADLAKVLDLLGEYDAAHAAIEKKVAHALKQPETRKFDPEDAPGQLHDVRAWITAGGPSRTPHAPAGPEKTPIFFVAFPRSGTTLMEQILASHSMLQSAGEHPALGQVRGTLLDMRGPDFRMATDLETLTADEITALRTEYWRMYTRYMDHDPAERTLVDKLPLNILYLPLVKLMFPDAKVLMAVRDPRDTCLSNVMQLFNMNKSMIHMLGLDRTTAFYADCMRTWGACRDESGLACFEYRYEDLVTNFDDTIGGVLDFLELPWEESVRDYRNTAKSRTILTPSYSGVMKKLNTQAVGRWKNYEPFMRPYMDRLAPYIEAYGYAPS